MFSTIALCKALLRRAFRSSRAVATPGVHPALGLEPLEARDVPKLPLRKLTVLRYAKRMSSCGSVNNNRLHDMGTHLMSVSKFSAILLIASVLGLLSIGPGSGQKSSASPPRANRLSEAEIQRLIGRLGSANFREREAATEALKRRPEAAMLLLRASRITSNPEVAQRLRSILPVMMSRDGAKKRLARLPEYVKNRQFDRLVETLVACREFITSEHDGQVRAFIQEAYTSATRGKMHAPTAKQLPDFKTFAWENRLGKVDSDAPTRVARATTPLVGLGTGVIAADRVDGTTALFRSVALCNGDVDIRDMVIRSLVITTGTVRVYGAYESVIIAPGHVVVHQGGANSVIVSAGRVVGHGDLDDGRGWMEKDDDSVIREQDTDFFAAWKLYSTSEAGARLWSIFGVVGIEKVVPNSPLARAGIRAGDILAQVDGTVIRSTRDVYRLLCRATVSWGAADLTIVSGDRRRELMVPLYDW